MRKLLLAVLTILLFTNGKKISIVKSSPLYRGGNENVQQFDIKFIDPLFPEENYVNTGQSSLSGALNHDGTLKPGMEGSFDPAGYTMSYGPNGEPIFTPATILGSGDERWQPMQSDLQGVDGLVNAIAVSGNNVYVAGYYLNTAGGNSARSIAVWDGSGWSALGAGVGVSNNEYINSIAVWDSKVYVGGYFTTAGGNPANNVAVWDGSVWSALGSGVDGSVRGLAVFNSFNVYCIAGRYISRWNGSTWSALGSGVGVGESDWLNTIAVYNLNKVYVGGKFSTIDGITANNIAVWNGSTWSALGSGVTGGNNEVHAIATDGPSWVYVGGHFTNAGGNPASHFALWDGSGWSTFGSGLNSTVHTILPGYLKVYVGGEFTTAGGNPANKIAVWNSLDSSWSNLGSGVNGNSGVSEVVFALAGNNNSLYVGGSFVSAGGNTASNIAAWKNNVVWGALGSGLNQNVNAIAVSGSNVYVGGGFRTIGGIVVNYIAVWNGSDWSALGSGMDGGGVNAIAVSGVNVYVTGTFSSAGGNPANRIAVWNGSVWSTLGSGFIFGDTPTAIAVSGSNVYVGGAFTSAGGIPANNIALWNGSVWSALGSGVGGIVNALAVSGGNVYVGGQFTAAGGNLANNIAVWNGSAWSTLGSGLNNGVSAITTWGNNVYVGGQFNTAGGNPANRVAVWNGSNWSALGTGLDNFVSTLAVHGGNVYVGGDFTSAGGNPANRVAVWNGNYWSALGTGLDNYVSTLAVSSSKVYVGGYFTGTGDGSVPANYIIQRIGVFPTATVQAGEAVSQIEVRLKGIVNSGGLDGTYRFEWGTASGVLINLTATQAMSGSGDIEVSNNVASTTPNTTIYYRIRVENAEGVFFSGQGSYTFPPEIEIRQGANTFASGNEYDFGNVSYQASSSAIGFTIHNLGLGSLNLTGSAGNYVVKGGAHPGDFTVVQNSVTSSITYNNNQPFTVQFLPSSGGARTATLTITNNDPDEGTYVINLKGTGVKLNQTITFGGLAVKTVGESPFTLAGTASSGLAVAYSSGTPSVATVSGNTVTIVGPGTSVITASQVGDGGYNAAPNVLQTITVLAAEPSAQPTNPGFSSVTASSFIVNFTAATGSPAGYIVVRREGAAPTTDPVDGTAYTVGATLGNGTIAYLGSAVTFNQTGLTASTAYHYKIYSYNGSGITLNYQQASPLQASQSTLVTVPTEQATNISFSAPTVNGLTVSWTNGNGTERLVVARQANAVNVNPVNGVAYTGNANFASATDLGSGNKVVYRGAGSSVTVTNLTANTVFHFRVYELNGTGVITSYLIGTATNNPNSRTTLQTEPTAQPMALSFNNINVSSLAGAFTAASGSPQGYLVLRRQGSAPTFTPVDGTTYSTGAQGDAVVVSSAAGTTFTDAGLVAGTVYHYAIHAFNGAGQAINYRTTGPLANSVITISAAPSSSTATSVAQTSFTANWSAVTGAANYVLDVSQDNFSNLLSGYSGKIVSGLNDVVTGLTPGTTYQYRVRASNASGLSSNSATISQLTLPATPIATAATSLSPTSFVANWSSVVSATGYLLDVATDAAFTNFQVGYNNLSVTNTSQSVTGLSSGVTFYYRVRSVNAAGLSPSSSAIETATITTEPLAQPTAINFSNLSASGLSVSYTAALGSPVGYIALIKEGSEPTELPQGGTAYTLGSTLGGSKIAYIGSATTFSISSLNANTIHHVAIFSYNGSGLSINYLTSNPLTGSRSTLQTEPVAQATNIIFNNVSSSSLTTSFTAAAGSPSGYLVLRKAGSVTAGAPSDGASYALNQSMGDGTVVSNGSQVSFDDTGLNAGSTYYYSVFSYNGSGDAINYLTTSPVSNSVITIAAAPTTQAGTSISQTSFTASWTSSTGAASYALDVSNDNFTTFITGYSAKSISGTSENITSLSPGTTYSYRVRALNTSGQSSNSNITTQITIPPTPTSTAASNIQSNDFKANWSDVSGEFGYELDVSSNNFVSFISGYQGKTLPADVIEEIVTGLSPSTTYQYRVRAKNAGGVSPNSGTITTTTTAVGGNSPLTISDIVAPSTIQVATSPITITTAVSGGSGTKNVSLFYRSITATSFVSLAMTNSTGNSFTVSIPANTSDDLGIEFYIIATASSESAESTKRLIYRAVSASQTTPIPTIVRFGGTLESYQIISIPFQLEDNFISSIFEPTLGAYDDTKWRLVRFQGGRNVDYQAGLTRINQGESYWFNSVTEVSVKPGAGTVTQANQSTPFTLALAQGWNQIATPFPFAIDWDDVLAANGNPVGVGKYKVYVPASLSFAESNSLQPYSGGFVFADPARELTLPVSLKNTAGGRTSKEAMGTNIAEDTWLLPITLRQGKVINPLGGIGMHPQASAEKDDYDDITLPRFVKHLEFNSYHNSYIAPRFSKDVVPTTHEHLWKISIESNFEEGDIELDWSGTNLGDNEAQLVLHDPAQGVLTDMKRVHQYTLKKGSLHELEIIYLREKKSEFNSLLLGRPYPNPSSGEVNFNVFSWEPARVQLEVYDLMGRKVHNTEYTMRGNEISTLQWQAQAGQERATAGMYLYKLTTYNGAKSYTMQGRIIIQ